MLSRQAGLSVVLERRELVGGACVTEELFPGFRLSVASYTVGMLQPEIVQELELREAGFASYVRDPQFTGVFPDGRHLVVYPDLERTVRDLARWSRRDAEAWPRFEADGARLGAILREHFNITGGNIFHGDLTLEQLFSLRPIPGFGGHRMPVGSLYLCGSGSHPGGDVSGLPGRNAATAVLRDLER